MSCPKQLGFSTETDFVHNYSYSSVILHEFGHLFVWEMTARTMAETDPTTNEALADVFTAYLLADPQVGRGWQKGQETTSFERDIQTAQIAVWPWCIHEPCTYETYYF
jgi:hypothetical protein